ncbi:MAG: NAD(P)-binding domain-containing protein [Akkermansiaceae bacterium]
MITLFKDYAFWLHQQWPAGGVEKAPEVNEDGTCNIPGIRVVGDLTGVPLLKFSADTGAKAVRRILAESDFKPGGDILDLVIIGAGVSGISAAIEASKNGINYTIVESAEAFSTIRNFPKKKPIYTYPTDMEPAGEMRFKSDVKEDLLAELEQQQQQHGIQVANAAIVKISRSGGILHLDQKNGEPIKAKRVIVAIGRTGNFRKLNVPGEGLEKVSNRLIDPSKYSGSRVLVVGGGDSALEAAISLAQENAKVDLSYRKKEFSRAKPDNIEKITQLESNGKITLHLPSNVQDIEEKEVTLCGESDCDTVIKNDYVFTLIGREAPLDFFRKSGIKVTGDRNQRWWLSLIGFGLLMTFLYHLKGYVDILGIKGSNLWPIFQSNNWFPFNIPVIGGENGLLNTTLITASSDPGFLFALAYTALIAGFGFRRIRLRKTPYVKLQTLTLTAFQVVPLFLLPYVLFPWMGANGAFTSGGFGEWFGMTFLSNGPGTEPTQYWRAFGFILAWPLFIYNIFTEAPLWGWLVLSFIQTFVILPLIIWRWGKGAYCGWICSCGAMAETLGDQHRQKMPHGPRWNKLNMIGQVILAICFLLLILRVIGWVFPSTGISSFVLGLSEKYSPFSYKYLIDLWLAGAIGYGLYFHFSGRVWCRFACPLAALMHIYSRFSRFRIFSNKEKCISCNVCTTVCHQGIDVMAFANKGKPMEDPECVRCSACVQSCPTAVLDFGRIGSNGEKIFDTLPASLVQLAERRKAK